MTIGSALAIYFIIWWIVLFAVLPFGIRSQAEAGDVAPGSDPGAPSGVNGRKIVLRTSIIASVVYVVFWLVYVENVFNLAVINDITRR